MGAVDKDPGTGGGRTEDVQDVLQGGSSVSVDLWVRDVGPDPRRERALGSFKHRVAWRITRRKPMRRGGGW